MCKRRKRIFRVSRSLACFRVFVFSCFRVFVFSLDVICGWAVQRVFTKKCFRRSVRQTETASLRLCRDNICTAVLAVATAGKPWIVSSREVRSAA